jgi:hypothetical protein
MFKEKSIRAKSAVSLGSAHICAAVIQRPQTLLRTLPDNASLCGVFIASMRTMTSTPRNGAVTSNSHVVVRTGSRNTRGTS